jgi:hypothetical protein
MEEKIILSQEELNSIKEVQELYNKITFELGQLELQKTNLENLLNTLSTQKTSVLNELKSVQDKETTLGKDLNNKYGNGIIDPDTGEFIKK